MTRPSKAIAWLWLLGLGAALSVGAAPALTTLEQAVRAWSALPPSEQNALGERTRNWDGLPADQREDQRARYQSWLALDAAERARLQAAEQAFAALPADEQARLHTLFHHQDLMQQRGWRLGPALGADWPRLQPLFAYVDPAQRGALLGALKALDASARDDLAALAQRVPPQSREGFRREFLKVPVAQRAAWLHQRRAQ